MSSEKEMISAISVTVSGRKDYMIKRQVFAQHRETTRRARSKHGPELEFLLILPFL